MDRLVSNQVAEEGKVLATLGAVEAFLPCVDTLVDLQVVGVGKLFPTLGTAIRLLSRVDPLVPLQAAELSKLLAALGALVRLLPCVHPLMDPQLAQVGILAETECTLVGPRLPPGCIGIGPLTGDVTQLGKKAGAILLKPGPWWQLLQLVPW